MKVTENTSLSGALEVTDANGNKKQVVNINSNLTLNGNNLNFNLTIMDTESVKANAVEVQAQLDEFMSTIKTKMIDLGYSITI